MDSTTFGNSKAAKELTKDLDELNNRRVTREVFNFLADCNKVLNEIVQKISRPPLRNELVTLYSKDRLQTLNTHHKRIPPTMKTFISNLVRTKTRSIIRGY